MVRRDRARLLAGPAATLVLSVLIVGCGGSSGPSTLSYYIFQVPSGSFAKAASDCSKAPGGIADATRLAKEGKPHYIEEQGAQYEGYTVWFNSLVNSAGGEILSGP